MDSPSRTAGHLFRLLNYYAQIDEDIPHAGISRRVIKAGFVHSQASDNERRFLFSHRYTQMNTDKNGIPGSSQWVL
jgi:hypothetical protein